MSGEPQIEQVIEVLRRKAETEYLREDLVQQRRAVQEFLGEPQGNFNRLQNSPGGLVELRSQAARKICECRDRIRPLLPDEIWDSIRVLSDFAGTWITDWGWRDFPPTMHFDDFNYHWELLRRYEQTLREILVTAEQRAGPRRTAGHLALDEPVAVVPETEVRFRFKRVGDAWDIRFEGGPLQVRDVLGLRYIAYLLARPGEQVSAMELLRACRSPAAAARTGAAEEQDAAGSMFSAGLDGPEQAVDEETLRDVEHQIRDLQERRAEAEKNADISARDACDPELRQLDAYLHQVTNEKGKPRWVGGTRQKARKAVSARIWSAVTRIEAPNRQLGRHLRASLHTGLVCSYRPEALPDWDL